MTDDEAKELTLQVAELLGWQDIGGGCILGSPETHYGPYGRLVGSPLPGRWPIPDFARSWDAMREVVAWIRERAEEVNACIANVVSQRGRQYGAYYVSIVFTGEFVNDAVGNGDDLPEAICRAALKFNERLKAVPPHNQAAR